MTTPLLEIKNLHANVEGNDILKGVNLTVFPGEVHSIMGPNGSGKSTLACVLAGHDAYEVTEGEIYFMGQDLLELDADQRACAGIFLAFQYPVEIPGVSTKFFLKAAVNAMRKYRGEEELDAMRGTKSGFRDDISPDIHYIVTVPKTTRIGDTILVKNIINNTNLKINFLKRN